MELTFILRSQFSYNVVPFITHLTLPGMNCLWVVWTALLDSPKLPKKAKTKGKKKLTHRPQP